ncbi:arginine--tRNA ligase, partial [Burkholderia pseudomallei]
PPAQSHPLETLLETSVKQVGQASKGAAYAAFVLPAIARERPKVAAHGDVASNVARPLAKPLGANPRQLAELNVASLT